MSNRNKKIGLLLSFLLVIVCAFLFPYNSAFADTKDTVLSKAVLQGLYRCYTTGAINKDAGTLSKFHKFETLITGGDNSGKYVALPASLTGINDNNISCKGLFMGDSVGLFTESGSFDGLFKMFGKSEYIGNITDDTKKTTLLKGMGYSSGSTSSTKKCVYYVYNNDSDLAGNAESYTDKVCLTNGELTVETTNWSCGGADGTCIAPVGFQANGKTLTIRDQLLLNEEKVSYSGDWDKFRNDLNTIMSSTFYRPESSDAFTYTFSSEKSENTQSTDGDVTYTFSDSKSAATDAIKFLSPSYTSYGNLAFTDQEKLWYYENTVTNWFYKDKSLDDYYKCGISENPSLNSQYIIINVNPSTGAKNTAGDCGVNKENNSKSDGIHGFDRNNHFSADGTIGTMDLASVVAIINSLVDGMDESELPADGTSEDSSEDGESSERDPCYNAGIEAMSWIICPALNNTSNTVDGIEGYLRDWLQIKTVGEGGIFENSNGTHLYDGWSIFRNLANGLLIIVLLIIIFSQLTGYGIDNYGIKKMLPKLILMGILINLSFLFCQLAVDISNILGVGLDNMMKAIAANMNGGTAPNYTTSTIVTAVLGTIAGAGAVAGVAAGAIGGGGVMIAIVLLLALLVALIAVLMFFVMLSARIIIVAVFIVISPVAFALYILPNTQNLFKKWWKIFETALVIYPICGALYGASYIIKAIVGGDSGGFIPGIIAVVAPFLPFLALPTLLRGAMAGLGALGGTLTMLGNGLRKGAQSGSGAIQSGIKNSERYKYNADRIAENRRFRWAERNRNSSNLATRRKAQTLLNERTQQRAQDAAGTFALDSNVAQSRAEAARDAAEYKAFQDQFANPNFDLANEANSATTWYDPNDRRSQQRMRALIGAMESNGMESQIFNMLRNNSNIGTDTVAKNALANSNNKVLKAYGKKSTLGQDFTSFMNGTGTNSMQGYINSKGASFVDGLDDKALAEIANYNNGAAMSDDLLVEAAAKLNDGDSLRQVNSMLGNRRIRNISGEQLANFDESTVRTLFGNSTARTAILTASDKIANDSRLASKTNSKTLAQINRLRRANGRSAI